MTTFEFEVCGDYGMGWEVVTTEDTLKDARERFREYEDNEPGTRHKIVRRAVNPPKKTKWPEFGSGAGGGK